jgi:exodeoxyribonuclease VII small subunit
MSEGVTFDQKVQGAKVLLEKLMDPEVPLEEALRLYEEGVVMLKEAEEMIEKARLKVQVIEQSAQKLAE